MAGLSDILETTQLEKVASGFVFTEGPLWHPEGFFYFVDIRANLLYRMVLGQQPQVVRTTKGGNGTTFDLQGRLINCEGDGRMVTRLEPGVVRGAHVLCEEDLSWEADAVVLVTQRLSDTRLYTALMSDPAALAANGIEGVFRIGDCLEPRIIADVVFDGHRLGREIDSPDPTRPLPMIREHRVLGKADEQYDARLTGRSGALPRSSVIDLAVSR